MDKLFDIIFLEQAFIFLSDLDEKHYEKILYNIRKVQTQQDPELFKKLTEDIWEIEDSAKPIQNVISEFTISTACLLG